MKKYVVAIDIGGTNTELAIVDEMGSIVDGKNFNTQSVNSFEDYISELSLEILNILEKNSMTDQVFKVGIGAPNANFYSGCIEHAPNLKWKGVLPLSEMLSKKINLPVVLTNDANAAAIGEFSFGEAANLKDFFLVTIGTGLGSGFFVNNELVYGHDGFAGELGHVIVDCKSDRLCGCGRYGCLETFVSSSGVVKTAVQLLEKSEDPSLLRKISPTELTSLDIATAAEAGDKIALEVFDFTAKIFGLALANTVAITSPQAIIISGGLAKSGDLLLLPLKIHFENFLLPLFRNKVDLKYSALLEKNTGMLGAAALAFNN